MEAQVEELTATSTESKAKSAQLEQQLQQLREEKEEVDAYLSEFEAASLAEGKASSSAGQSMNGHGLNQRWKMSAMTADSPWFLFHCS